jgi:CHAD domain-containing protein
MKLILTHMVEVMQQNEEGIKSDIDTEFLHDFRISVRRTRSALGQIKKVLPQEVTDRFRKDFALIGQSTNHLRDLDVYLLRKGQYHDLLPKDLRKGINPFFQHIASERTKERTRVIRFLNGTRYAEIMRDWKQYLGNQEEELESQNASKPIINLARKVIRKKYDLALRQGKAIKASSPDEALHELRLTCKKLRYLLEIFSSLFPRKKINRLISQLKKLQDNLGRYNDLIIQQDRLKDYLDQVDPQSARALDIAAAIGGLVAHLHLEQIKVRSEFRVTFVNFSRVENVKLCRELFQ